MKKLLFLCGIISTMGQAQVLFQDQASTLGINEHYGNGFLGGGISFYDYNQDGWDDITISSETGNDIYFFKNIGGSFEREFLSIDGGSLQTKQLVWVDFDNDGDLDFFAASDSGLNKLFSNNGDNTFVEVTVDSGLPLVPYDTFGGAWGDYDNDGFLDVFLTIRDGSETQPNLLFHNNGDRTFSDVTATAGLETTGYLSFCAAFFDYNNDGFQDIYMANDKFTTENILYKNNGDGTFDNVSAASGTNLIMGAMSTTIDDYNNDGWLDIYVSNDDQQLGGSTTEGNALLRNNQDGTFTNVATQTGTLFNSVGWGCVFLDAENDSDHDLYVSGSGDGTNGNLPSAFYENDGVGNFSIPANAGFQTDTRQSFSNAIGDVDNDGYPDIAVLNDGSDDIFLWKNISPQNNNWLKVGLRGTESNTMGIGSWIEIRSNGHVQYHYTVCGEGYLGQNSGSEFFGIADATIIDYVKVTWLSGIVDLLVDVTINEHLMIVEGEHPVLGMEDAGTSAFTIYPNPASETVTVHFSETNFVTALVIMYDISGKKILETTVDEHNPNINVQSLESGLYFLEITSEKNRAVKRLIVN